MKKKNEVTKLLEIMLKKFTKDKIGANWFVVASLIMKQTELTKGDIFSPICCYSNSFAGEAADNFSLANQVLYGHGQQKWIQRLQGLLVRFFLKTTLLNPLWSWVFKKLMIPRLLSQSDENYNLMVKFGYEVYKDEIEKYNLYVTHLPGRPVVEVMPGKYLSGTALKAIRPFLMINQLVTGELENVYEIGTGTGELARIFLQSKKAKRYFLVDVPPALAFSEFYLKASLGEHHVDGYDPERKEIDLNNNYKAFILTPDQIHLIPKFDLGISIASFQEMTFELVKSNIEFIKNQGKENFISINLRKGKVHNQEKITEESYTTLFADKYLLKAKHQIKFHEVLPILHPDYQDPQENGYQLLYFKRENPEVTLS